MDRRTFIRSGLGAAGTLVIVSCTKKNPSGITPSGKAVPPSDLTVPAARVKLREWIDQGAGLPSPFGYSPQSYALMTYIFDTLLLADPTGVVGPWLAANHTMSPDGLVHTLELRDNVKWHDGQAFTPEDVLRRDICRAPARTRSL